MNQVEDALNDAFERFAIINPALCTLMRSCPHRRGTAPRGHKDGEDIPLAWATDRACYYSDRILGLTINELMGLIMHEFSHVLLRHAERAQMVLRLRGSVSHSTMNVAADLSINHWIETVSRRRWATSEQNFRPVLPPGGITPGGLQVHLPALDGSPLAVKRNISRWEALAEEPTEFIYAVLCELIGDNYDAALAAIKVPDLDRPEGDVETFSDNPTTEQSRAAHLAGTLAGTDPWGFTGKLHTHLPKAEINWHRHLRILAGRLIGAEIETNWSRPSRRIGSYPKGIFAPGMKRRDTPSIAAIIDTSMSVGNGLISKFMSETRGIARLAGADVIVIEADVEVRRISTIRPEMSDFTPLLDKGRGGTNFTAALRAAANLKPDLIIYLTDLYADEPKFKPRSPVIWVAPFTGAEKAPSFGKVVRIQNAA